MNLGAVFPQTEGGTDVAALRNCVQSVETIGCDYLLCELTVEEDYPHRITDSASR